jgi:hypothetical protein
MVKALYALIQYALRSFSAHLAVGWAFLSTVRYASSSDLFLTMAL